MMKRNRIRIAILLVACIHIAAGTLAQVGHGGNPVMNDTDFDAAQVLYLLPPEDPVKVEGLKSTGPATYKKPLQFATERPVDMSPEVNGQWVSKDDMQIWRVHLVSPGAYSLGLYFSAFELTENASLFVYNPDGTHIKGAYTWQNNKDYGHFTVGHLPGEELVIELQVTGHDRDYGRLRLDRLSHAFLPVFAEMSAKKTSLGSSQDCEIDINCAEGDDWQIMKRSICQISISTPASTLLCSGVLINNTAYDGKPYILTAEHCINSAFYAARSVFYFDYENSECGANDATRNKSISGSSLYSTGDSIDFTLVKMSDRPPRDFQVYYAGWDANDNNHKGSATLHHPNGDAMKISFDFDETESATWVPGDLNDYVVSSNYHIRNWDIGTTEGGSSGAPLFNLKNRVIGTLSGGLAVCGDSIGYDEENDRVIYSQVPNRDDFYSKFYYNWDFIPSWNRQLKGWLDPTGTGQLSIGGLSSLSLPVQDHLAGPGKISAWPNPSDGIFNLLLPEYQGTRPQFEVLNMNGQKVQADFSSTTYPFQVDITGSPPGIYLLRISTGDVHHTGRLVIE